MRTERRFRIRQERARLRKLTAEVVQIAKAKAAEADETEGRRIIDLVKPAAWRGHTPLVSGLAFVRDEKKQIVCDQKGNPLVEERANFNMRGGGGGKTLRGTKERTRDGGLRFVRDRNRQVGSGLLDVSPDYPPSAEPATVPEHVADVRGEYEQAVYAALDQEDAAARTTMMIPAPVVMPPAPKWPDRDA